MYKCCSIPSVVDLSSGHHMLYFTLFIFFLFLRGHQMVDLMLILKCLFQIINVYITKYECGGHFWPLVHNTVIFSLVMMQIIALGVFGLKKSPISSGFTIPLVIFTILFNQYCRQRFRPVFKNHVAEVLFKVNCLCDNVTVFCSKF